MGHAHHFLSRLDRVSMPQVELALSLYRDEPLLKLILERARVPENVERVALGLENTEAGPHIVVTRSGRFVTCLGAGMKTGELHVVTRGQIDAISAKVSELRERFIAAQDITKGRGVKALLNKIWSAADELCREDFIAISALQPIYAFDFLRLYLRTATDLSDARDLLLPHLRKTDRLRPAFEEQLRAYWQAFWALGHLLVLATMDGIDALHGDLTSFLVHDGQLTSLSWPTTRQGFIPLALRGAWAVGRLGKPMLQHHKQFYHNAITHLQNLDGAIGLAALGLRHSRLEAEVEKALDRAVPERIRDDRAHADYLTTIRRLVTKAIQAEQDAPGAFEATHRKLGASLWVANVKKPGPLTFKSPEDVPEELAMPFATYLADCFFETEARSSTALLCTFTLLPWVARASPEELYLPRDAVSAIQSKWTPETTLTLLRAFREQDKWYAAHRKPDGPARKGPCPCGSGKKYKRCCGEGASP